MDLSKSVTDIPEWFRGCRLNYAENLLHYASNHGDKTALITAGEGQSPVYVSFSQLKERVATIASALSAAGVVRGDIVAGKISSPSPPIPISPTYLGYLPNSSLAVETMLATASIGATWTSTSPDFGITVCHEMF